jgi:hypothetical protein
MVRLHANLLELYSPNRGKTMFTNFVRRFFSIGMMIGDEIAATFFFCLMALPHVLLFIVTLGLSKAIMDTIQERTEKKALVARLTERQRIETESTKRWMALREKVNVYDPIAMKAYMKV